MSTSPDTFDRIAGALDGLPDVRHTRPTTISSVQPMIGTVQTFIVQTYRQREAGDTIFVQLIDADGGLRIALPAKVADAIARQRDALTTANRRANGRAIAEERMARGERPAFLKPRRAESA